MGYRLCRTILYLAAVVTPFTALRFGVIGSGEIFFIVALILTLLQSGTGLYGDPAVKPLTTFWVGYLSLALLGFLFNVFALGHVSGTYSGAAFDFFSYALILAVVLILGHPPLYSGTSAKVFNKTLFTLWAMVFVTLYLISRQTTHILGLPLRYYSYFAPLVDNVHQAATITSPMPFIMWHLALQRQSSKARLLYIIAGICFVWMALESGSTKAALGLVAGAAVSVTCFLFQHLPLGRSRGIRRLTISAVGALAIAGLVMHWDSVMPRVVDFFYENDGNAARENLYTRGMAHGLDSFVIGYGPGPHVALSGDTFWDAHNTFLTAFLQGGLCAVLLLSFTVTRVGAWASSSVLLLGALAAIGVYVLGGDVLRRLPTWVMLVGIMYLSRAQSGFPTFTAKRSGLSVAAHNRPVMGG